MEKLTSGSLYSCGLDLVIMIISLIRASIKRRIRSNIPSTFRCTMKGSTFIFFVVSCSAVFSEAVLLNGTSPYCRKSQLNRSYPGTNKECCGFEGVCREYIGPNETKWGLTNPDPEWIRRSCSCDITFYDCVTRGMDYTSIRSAEEYGFSRETCFQKVARSNPTRYEFVSLMTVLRNSGRSRLRSRGNQLLSWGGE